MASDRATSISLTGENQRVIMSCHNHTGRRMPVVVTPLSTNIHLQPRQLQNQLVQSQVPSQVPPPPQKQAVRVLLKAVKKKGTKSDSSLRNVILSSIESINMLKDVIREGISDDITSKDFDVGYLQGSNVIRIRSREDISELCSLINKPQSNITLWCDGLRDGMKRQRSESDEETDEDIPRPKKKQKNNDSERDKKVQVYVDELNGSKFSPMQLRIWGELKAGGRHASLDNPPTSNTMFLRSGVKALQATF